MKLSRPNWIPKDKWIHFIVGIMISPWFIIEADFSLSLGFIGWIICVIIAYVLKELLFDLILGKGKYEFMDAAWTMITPTLFLIIYIIQQL